MCSTDNNFSLWITNKEGRLCNHLTSKEKKDRSIDEKHHYVKVVDGSNITIVLYNRRSVDADVTLLFEGKNMGLYRVNAESKFEIKRPSNSDQGFFVHAEKTLAAASTGVEVDRKENGLIEARIVFAKAQQVPKTMDELLMVGEKTESLIVSGASKGGSFYTGTRGVREIMSLERYVTRSVQSIQQSQPVPVKAAAITLGAPTGQNFGNCKALTDIDAEQSRILLLRVLAIPATEKVNSEGQVAVAKLPIRPSTPPRIEN